MKVHTEQRYNDPDGGKQKYSEINLLQHHLVHSKYNTDWPAIKSRPLG
jgi:hypothetical protein